MSHHNILKRSAGQGADSTQGPYSDSPEDVSNAETQNGLLAQVKELAKNAADADKAFECIRVGLKTLNDVGFQGENAMSISKFQLAWVEFQKVGP